MASNRHRRLDGVALTGHVALVASLIAGTLRDSIKRGIFLDMPAVLHYFCQTRAIY
jgi:hypothetical protein